MPPVTLGGDIMSTIKDLIVKNKVMVFSKTTCPFCTKVKDLFKSLNIGHEVLELDTIENGAAIQNALYEISKQKTVPNVFINGKHVGGCDDTLRLHAENQLMDLVYKTQVIEYQYDLVVIGGGSGGLAAAKEAATLGKRVALLDFVEPTPLGTSWGLGGTCVNVGCIPKKLMHTAALLREAIHDSKEYGWDVPDTIQHSWAQMVESIQNHIGSLNWNYKVDLRDKEVTYFNAFAEFVDIHTVKARNRKGEFQEITAETFIIATGERPKYPDIPGIMEHCITSDDLFSLSYCPGKTLCVGASYVSLECAGFLAGLGLDVTVMVRSILLRGFDQQMAELIGDYMKDHKVQFIRGAVPTKIEKIEDGNPGKLRVTAKAEDGTEIVDVYNTVLIAIGRDPCTSKIGLDKIGVNINPNNNRVIVDEREATNIPNIYAVGDILDARLQLTPVAIQAGRLLVRRLYAGSSILCDYINVPTTVFTPLEYGSIGYSEEAAIAKFGEDKIEVYHSNFRPLEWTVVHREENACYAKLICLITENERVIGFHVLGPNAGEITQGFGVAMKKGATKSDFDSTIGIHPTCAEVFNTLIVTKRSGASTAVGGC